MTATMIRPDRASKDSCPADDLEASLSRLRRASRGGVLAAHEREALEALYVRYRSLVWATVYPLLASAADADDITQTIFVGLPRALRSYRPGNFEAWLRRVAVRFALMSIRASKRASVREARSLEAVDINIVDDPRGHTALLGDDESMPGAQDAGIRRAFYALPEAIREVVFMRAIVEMSHAEIAEWLGITPGASYTRYCRGLARLRQAMEAPCLDT